MHFAISFTFFQGLFPPGQGATIGVDFMIKTVDVDGDRVKVSVTRTHCWDVYLGEMLHVLYKSVNEQALDNIIICLQIFRHISIIVKCLKIYKCNVSIWVSS